jgi:hypothetical protein
VDRRDFDILAIPPPIALFVLDAQVRKMNLVIEVGEVVVVRPCLYLVRLAIGPAIRVVAFPISLVQPLLVLPLELVVEGDAIDACAAFPESPGFPEVGAIYLGVVFHLTRLLEAGVELLAMVLPTVLVTLVREIAAVRLQHSQTFLSQDNGHVPTTVQPLDPDEPFLAEVSEVARPRIGRALVVAPEVA